ncbi:related to naringenin,2-oxoglutarate 3-dioxygenase [Ramularia collo-cygni]|uniref:Related to naringenin,2-oxoglutarate 3-dioxygenase n=1 Tax=Ramularia collo-cygni TaxID=112498 RepID=A0A2D3UTD4_9PEZI|nr:related to naringenin,2-oxoglutarate 3-dioxygenase [Ramularia collo-cygni]CZT16060.1 related to naringenin,2-oxoglutarate 3-dioxygenase [Ramularia collo-cygni]
MSTLKTVKLVDIVELEPQALDNLKFAATQQGFFHLDIDTGSDLSSVNADIAECFDLAIRLYDLPLHEKLSYDIDKMGAHKLNGYKPSGRNAGIKLGTQDGFEAYLIPRDGVATQYEGEPDALLPPTLCREKELLKRTMNELHSIGMAVLRALSIALANSDQYELTIQHRPQHPSTSALGLLKYSPVDQNQTQLGHSAHTDVGSLTLLFCTGPGLQFLDPLTGQWENVEVRPGQAVVNIGDSLRFLTGNRLKSCLHRVLPVTGDSAEDRYSLAYFLRPEIDTTFRDEVGQTWKSIDWHDNKYKIFRASLEQQSGEQESLVLTGKAGFLGLWEPLNDPLVAS